MKKPINRHLTWVKPLNPILEVLVRKRGEATMSPISENVKRVYKETLR
jgi:predicted transcriptional regulator